MKTTKLALFLVFAYLMINCVNLINQEMRLQHYQARLDEDLAKTAAEHKKLQEQLKYFNTPQGVEELARKRLGYYKKGEVPMRVIAAETQTGSQAESQQIVTDLNTDTPRDE